MIRNRLEELGYVGWMIIVTLIIVVVVAAVSVVYTQVVYPQILQGQRNAVEQSKSYLDANNIALSNYIVQYNDSQATDGQKKAIINAMCQIINTMPEVAPNTLKFIYNHGGCDGQ